jgi:AcrR family transcriptional regulator
VRIQKVQQAAVLLFAERGFAATGIREIGRKLELNSATLYHYTGSKEDLLVGIMRLALENLSTMGQSAVARSARPIEQLGYLVSAHVGLAALNPLTSKVIDHELRSLAPRNYETLLALRDEYEALWAEVFERGLSVGEFAKDTDAKVARLAVIEMCNGVANWFHADGPLTIIEIQERFVNLAGRMVGVDRLSDQLSEGHVTPVKLDVEPTVWTG